MRSGWCAPALTLAGCSGAPANVSAPANDIAVEAPATPAEPAPVPTVMPTPTAAAPFALDSAKAAADVVQRYHALIAAKRYDDAYRLWEPGAAGMSVAAFAASFAKYAGYHADVGAPGDVDAGAGQRNVTVPVRVSGRLAAGGSFAMAGPFTLHRVADIDGATAEQRQWRIRSSALKPQSDTASDRATARYRCMDGRQLVATFDTAAGTVTLRRGGERLGVLGQQRAASGIWYKGDGLELRGTGDAATFNEPGNPPIACTAVR